MEVTTEENTMAREDTMGDAEASRTAAGTGGDAVIVALTFKRSSTFGALAGALAKAQGEIAGATKDKTNPHFKSSYADLASVRDACRDPLSKAGIAVLQPVLSDGPRVTVTTLLAHASGEWISTDLTMAAGQNTPQAIGSCITYARRYALASMVGVAPEDDDGNAASQQSPSRPQAVPQPVPPEGFDEWLIELEATAMEGTEALQSAWKKSQPFMRKYLTDTDNARWERLKKKAAAVPVSA